MVEGDTGEGGGGGAQQIMAETAKATVMVALGTLLGFEGSESSWETLVSTF